MIRTSVLVLAAVGVAVATAAIPATVVATADAALGQPGAMILLATALFGLASAVRRHGKGTPPR